MNQESMLSQLITNKKAVVGIVGVGYVGTNVATAAARAGFTTLGFDIDPHKIKSLNSLALTGLTATSKLSKLTQCDIICICVPTPLDKDRHPDLSILKTACSDVAKYMHTGTLVVLESSVTPGTTRTKVAPLLETSRLAIGKDFFLAFSPERVNPGQSINISSIPKIVSGYDTVSARLATVFYKKIVNKVVPVSSLETAELTKVLENTFRLVNISLINEMADYARFFGINIWEVIEAAGTKPFGFLPHFPGPGAGGYCIPVLPEYLLESARGLEVSLPTIEQAITTNSSQPGKIALMVNDLLQGKKGAKILLIGISYKKNVPDIRESMSIKVLEELLKYDYRVNYHDPLVPKYKNLNSRPLTLSEIKFHDILVILTAHREIDYKMIAKAGIMVFDTVNALKKYHGKQIHRL
ncbi:MAG: nucleotide sugar dehydrogenase [Patescibacteria group bacterium]